MIKKNSLILSNNTALIKKELLKLNGHNFAAFFSKEIDNAIKASFAKIKLEFFENFSPNDDEIPLCILALSNYALNDIGYACKVEIALIYKDLRGFNIKDFANALKNELKSKSANFNIEILALSSLFAALKNDIAMKEKFAWARFIAGSKKLYKESKNELVKAKEQGKNAFIRHFINALKPFDDILLLSQKPDLKSGYGGLLEFERTLMLLNLKGSAKENALKFISEKEYSEFILSSEFLSSFISALRLSGGNDSIESAFLENSASILQIKTKRELDIKVLLVAKALSAMQKIAVFSRYLLKANFLEFFSTNLGFKELKNAKQSGHFYLLENAIYTPLHAKSPSLLTLLKNINALPDTAFKFHIESILYIKRIDDEKCSLAELLEFRKIFYRNNSFWILKALLDGEKLFTLIKPMEHTRHLAQFENYKFSVDEYSLMCVFYLENIKDEFVKSLYDELSAENKALLKLVALMHEVAKSQGGDNSKHAIQGANIFRPYASKLGLSTACVNLGVNLIKNHSLMNIALKDGNKNALKLISHIDDIKALKMLYILTYSIVNATNEGFYSTNAATTLKELYENAIKALKNADTLFLGENRARAKKENLIKKNPKFLELENSTKSRIFQIISNLFFIKYKADEIINIALWAMECANISAKISDENGLCVRLVVRRGWNMAMVLSELLSFDLEYMEIFELFDNKFFVKLKFAKSLENSNSSNLEAKIIAALCDKRQACVQKPVILPNEISYELCEDYAKININAKDSRGFMAYILSAFAKFNLCLANARIQTIKNRTRNLYLVELDKDFECNFENFKNYITN